MALQQSDKKYLVYEDQIEQSVDEKRPVLHSGNLLWFWSERLVLIESEYTDGFWHFQAIDLLTNESRPISFPRAGSLRDEIRIFPLAKNYGFIVESIEKRSQFSLIKINWETSEIQVFEQFEAEEDGDDSLVFVDKMQPSKFILKIGVTYEVCKLNGEKIEFGDVHILGFFEHYSNDKLFVLLDGENNIDLKIQVYDLLSKKTQSIQVKEWPGYDVSASTVGWIKNRVYAVAKSRNEIKFDVAWTDSETKRFTLIDFTTVLDIYELKFLNDNLLVFAKKSKERNRIFESTVEVYSIPMRRPHSLRQMAYLLVVQEMKNSGVVDPYKAATRYLPFNTDLRASWFEDKAKDENEATDNRENLDAKEGDSDKDELNSDQSEDESSSDGVSPKRYKTN